MLSASSKFAQKCPVSLSTWATGKRGVAGMPEPGQLSPELQERATKLASEADAGHAGKFYECMQDLQKDVQDRKITAQEYSQVVRAAEGSQKASNGYDKIVVVGSQIEFNTDIYGSQYRPGQKKETAPVQSATLYYEYGSKENQFDKNGDRK
jgi:hypothetical protein